MLPKKGGSWCSAFGCTSNSKECSNISFFTFPRNPIRSKTWILAINRTDLLLKSLEYVNRNCRVCEKHFDAVDISRKGKLNRKYLSRNAVPIISQYNTYTDNAYVSTGEHTYLPTQMNSSFVTPTIYTGIENNENEFIMDEEGNLVEIEILNEDRNVFNFERVLGSKIVSAVEPNIVETLIDALENKGSEITDSAITMPVPVLIQDFDSRNNLYIKSKYCLVCLEKEGTLSIHTEETFTISIADKIQSFIDLTISTDSGLPSQVCIECALRINDAFKLKTQCQESIKIFKDLLHNMKSTSYLFCKRYKNEGIIKNEENNKNINISKKTGNEFSHVNSTPDIQNSVALVTQYKIQDNITTEIKLQAERLNSQSGSGLISHIMCDEMLENIVNHSDSVVIPNFNTEDEQFIKEIIQINECEKVFKRKSILLDHKILHTNERTYECEICSIKFRQIVNLKRHRRAHTEKKKFMCDICSRLFKSNYNLKMHLHKHNKQYKCVECGKQFKRNSSLLEHKIIHTTEMPYECEICSKKFQQKYKLRSHLYLHNRDKQFICEICSCQYNSLPSLNEHKLNHGEPKFKCDKCEKLFHTPFKVRRHAKRHKENSFACDQCDKILSTNNSLRSHKRCVHLGLKNYKCSICAKEFYNLCNYQIHLRTHTGEKPFECEKCGKRFIERRLLNMHLHNKHNIKIPVVNRKVSKVISFNTLNLNTTAVENG